MSSIQLSQEIRAYLLILVDLLKGMAWPLVLIAILYYFKNEIAGIVNLILKNKETLIKIPGFGVEIKLTAGEAADALSDVFNEMDLLIEKLITKDEVSLFLAVKSSPRIPTVGEVIPGFDRQTNELKKLRALRGAYFIRPLEGGKWTANSHIEITTLGLLVLRYKKDVLLNKV